jgi:hypothetical protein
VCTLNTGPDWLQQLIVDCGVRQRSRILMTLWRSWHLRCDVTHGKGEETIARSVAFLLSYDRDLQNVHVTNPQNDGIPLCTQTLATNQIVVDRREKTVKNQWQIPQEGTLKINVDASFIEDTGDATIGIIARDHLGQISMAASLVIDKCSDAEEAEACAIREGLNLSLEHNLKPVAVESDCAVAVAAANRHEAVASRCWGVQGYTGSQKTESRCNEN